MAPKKTKLKMSFFPSRARAALNIINRILINYISYIILNSDEKDENLRVEEKLTLVL